jgi:serine/threonine-protein kinase
VHDHVIPIHSIDTSSRGPFLVMPYINGRSLQERLDAEGTLELAEVLRIGLQTARGLAAAHAQGLVHRDIKPANILLENGVQRVRITDFGLARAIDDASQTQSGFIAGTPQYMAPEQARGEPVDTRADLFSLGSVMYAMCAGHSPFRAETTLAVLRRICEDRPRDLRQINPAVPAWLVRIIERLLAKDPADRFQSATEVADLLENWLAHVQQPTLIKKPAKLAMLPTERWALLQKSLRASVAVGACVGALALTYAAGGWLGSESSPPITTAPAGNAQAGWAAGELPLNPASGEVKKLRLDEVEAQLVAAWQETLALEEGRPSFGNTSISLAAELHQLQRRIAELTREVTPATARK